ncbi:MAG: glycosylase, partial [Planctomycetes bacterium]|nr:glycosylase [Planctomycetota bacterium]
FFDKAGQGDILTFLKSYLFHSKKTRRRGYIAIPTGNHDMGRISQGRSQKEIELVFAFILTMPGVPFIYYGDEIGMKTIKNLPSKEGGYTRTGSRTPMQWTPGRNAGFSKASSKKLYLPIDRAKNFPNVKSQLKHPNSLLNKVRALIALRRDNPALGGDGEFEPLYAKREEYPFVYSRRFHEQQFVVAINPSEEAIHIELGKGQLGHDAELVFGSAELSPTDAKRTKLSMGPVSYAVFRQW